VKGDIKYTDVYFAYPTRPTVSVLNGLNMNILHGKTVALVGSSGCGKSTIIQLLERFYDPASGEVSLEREDVKNVDINNLRSHLGVVVRYLYVFITSPLQNICNSIYTEI
jgi:ATP-binding cassette subfamily B (MDR/TAP) protein 1